MPMQPALGQTTLKVRQHEVNLNNQRRKREPSIETDSNSLVVNPSRRQLGFSICLFLSVLNTRLYIPHSYPTMSIPGISVLFLRTGFSPGSPQCDRWQMHSKTRWLTNCNVFWEIEDSSIFVFTHILTTFPLLADVDLASLAISSSHSSLDCSSIRWSFCLFERNFWTCWRIFEWFTDV